MRKETIGMTTIVPITNAMYPIRWSGLSASKVNIWTFQDISFAFVLENRADRGWLTQQNRLRHVAFYFFKPRNLLTPHIHRPFPQPGKPCLTFYAERGTGISGLYKFKENANTGINLPVLRIYPASKSENDAKTMMTL